MSNTDWFSPYTNKFSVTYLCGSNLLSILKKIFVLYKIDTVIINGSPRVLVYLCLLKLILPFYVFRIISLDLILSRPHSLIERIKSTIFSYLYRKVDYFLLYFKEWSSYVSLYKIPYQKFRYIPFKVNCYDDLPHLSPVEGAYIFSGGMSKRDYSTLLEAVRGQKIELRLLLPPAALATKHGTTIRFEPPPNVTVIHHNCDPNSWNEAIARAKFVVIPIKKDTISATGISTYLVAMALKKCVIVSAGPATISILPKDCAVIVEPENVQALRDAICIVSSNSTYRTTIAENGYRYAMSLKGHQRLVTEILELITTLP